MRKDEQCSFQFCFTRTLLSLRIDKKAIRAIALTETDDYDRIFTALKHPIRRQILVLLEENDEASFTEIQKAVGVADTGLLSYHLKELAPLVAQSERGRYILSEVGQASMTLFRKVEKEKQATSINVQRFPGGIIGQAVFLFLIVAVTLTAPLSVDIYLSVQSIYSGLTTDQLVILFLAGVGGMIFGAIAFMFYDRRYFSTKVKTNVAHCLLFAASISLFSTISAYVIHSFEVATLEIAASTNVNSVTFLLGIIRALSFLLCTPIMVYVISKFLNKRQGSKGTHKK